MEEINLINFVGIAGMLILLYGYLMAQKGDWTPEMLAYDTTNAIGSFLLVIYALSINSWPFVILFAIWCFTASMDFWHGYKGHNDKRSHLMKPKK